MFNSRFRALVAVMAFATAALAACGGGSDDDDSASVRLVNATLHVPRLVMAIIAISFLWTIGAVLFILFPPLVKNVLTSDKEVASVFLGVFSIGVSIGAVVRDR